MMEAELSFLVWCCWLSLLTVAIMTPYDKAVQVVSHRGAAGYIPEHSPQAHQTAIDLLTDYIELDVCITKDYEMVVIHDITLDQTTDVSRVYPGRNNTYIVNGKETSGYFVIDFTLKELNELKLRQRVENRTRLYNGLLHIPTVDTLMELVVENGPGLYIELKKPSWHNQFLTSVQTTMEDMLLSKLKQFGYLEHVYTDTNQVLPIVIECFEEYSLQYLRNQTNIPLVQLIPSGKLEMSKVNLKHISSYADIIGPDKKNFDGRLSIAQQFVCNAHELGLKVHPYTFRAESEYVMQEFDGDFQMEQSYFIECLHVDGLFTEFADRTREVYDDFVDGNILHPECFS
jgi:glycerophosphoryl diester phosphodiesterase